MFVRISWETICKSFTSAKKSPLARRSKNIRRQFSQFRTLAFLQFNMRGDGLVAEPADDVIESIRGAVHIRVINLIRVAGKDDFRTAADARDDGLGFERRQILRLVNDHELVGDAAATDVAQRLDDDAAAAHEVGGAAMFVAHVQVAQHFERVVNRLHPRRKFFLERTGQKAEFLAHGDRRPRDDEPAEFPVVHHALEAGRHRNQSFARAGLAHERDELDAVIQQRIEREMLFTVARLDAPDTFAAVEDGNQFCAGRIHFGQRRFLEIRFVGERAVFVREIFFAAVQHEFALRAEGRQFFRRHRQVNHPRVKVGDEHAVVLIILRHQTERVGLDAQIDVLGDQDRRVLRLRLLDAGGERKNAVVHRILGEDRFAVGVFVERDFELPAVWQLHARAQAAFAAKAVEHPRNRARIAAQLGGLALEAVNLLDDLDGHEDIVFLKIDERIRVVEQNIGIQNIIFHESNGVTEVTSQKRRRWFEYFNNGIKAALIFFVRTQAVNFNPPATAKLVRIAGLEPANEDVSLLPGISILLSFITHYYTTIHLINQHIFGIYG